MKLLVITICVCFQYNVIKALTYHEEPGKSSRIIGGFQGNIRHYPYAAAITIQTYDSRHFCGGTLYQNQWVITAAHCVDGATTIEIKLGSATLNDADDNRLILATNTYHLHPEYKADTLENDIAVIQLRMSITFTDYINSIGKLSDNNITTGIIYYSLGWGQTSDQNSSLSNTLRVGYLTPISNEECKISYGDQITNYMVCAAGSYNEGICYGDTGGALVEILRSGESVLRGVASFFSSLGCETTDPSGFTRVFPYVSWIKNITEAEYSL